MHALFHKKQGKWTCNSYGEDHKDGHHIVQVDRQLLPVVAVRGEPQVEGELLVLSADNASTAHLVQPATEQAVLPAATTIVWWLSRSTARDLHRETVVLSVRTLRSGGHFLYRQFNIQQFYVLPTQYLCVLCGSENKQRLFPYTALTDWFL